MSSISGRSLFYGVLLLCLLCRGPGIGAQSETSSEEDVDQYSINLVKALLEQPQGFSVSWLEKRQQRLGDRAAIALLKAVGEQKLVENSTLLRMLAVIRGAFSTPCLIEIPVDREPNVTMFVLKDLERQVKDEGVKKKILDTMTFVQQSTSTSCEEDKARKSGAGGAESVKH